MAVDVINPEEIDRFLRDIADGEADLTRLLIVALKRPLLMHMPALVPVTSLPENAPAWMQKKWEQEQVLYHFNANRDIMLDDKVNHVRDWIKGAMTRAEPWTQENKPRRLTHFKTVDDAYEAADKAMMALNRLFADVSFDPVAGTDVAMEFEDGFKIRQLKSPESKDYESQRLHHCVGQGGYDSEWDEIYSLRDADENPLVTFQVIAMDLVQCRGLQNGMPSSDVYPYLQEFIVERGLVPVSDIESTGVLYRQNKYYSIFDLPDHTALDSLDLRFLHTPLTLPENLCVYNKATIRCYGLREGQTTETIKSHVTLPKKFDIPIIEFIQTRGKKHHNNEGPASIIYNFEEETICETWCQKGFKDRRDGPAVTIRHMHTGAIISQEWHILGQKHREDGPASIFYNSDMGKVTEIWYRGGVRHRDDGPAMTVTDPQVQSIVETWYSNGKIHRADGPAQIALNQGTGIIEREAWYKDDKFHRVDGPASTHRDTVTGHVITERWLQKNKLHRLDGPADIKCNRVTGTVLEERWVKDGQMHRSMGPADIRYDQEGRLISQKYFYHGVEATHPAPTHVIAPPAIS